MKTVAKVFSWIVGSWKVGSNDKERVGGFNSDGTDSVRVNSSNRMGF